MITRIIWGLVITLIGSLMVTSTSTLLSFFGSMDWADEMLTFYGGSRLAYKMIGIGVICIGFLLITGLFDTFIYWFLSPIIHVAAPVAPTQY